MKKTTLIITEKKNISKQIAKALAPAGTFGERGHSEAEHCDIISLRTNYEKTKIKQSNGRNIGCKILNKGLKEKDYFYFCGENCKSCEFIAQHLDKLGTHSARSVRKKFKYINENLTSDFRSIILDLISESGGNANLSYFYKEIEEGEYPQKEKIDKSKNPLENVILQACQTLIHEKKIKQNKNGFELTQDGKRYKKYSLKDFAITEDIIYYMFDRDNSQIIIADTYGTPYGFNRKFPGNEDLEQAVTSAKDWADFQRLLRYMPNKQAYDPKDLKSHMARTMLFNSIISKRKAPDGADIYLEKIIAATDFDIAGSYIFNSIIEAANKNVEDKKNSKKSKGLHTIEPDLLYRMPLKSLESENIIAEFNNLQNFDWNNAYAGKARSVFDFIYGSTITGKLNKEARKLQNAKRKKKHELRFSVGRTLFLGLKKVIEEEQQMKYAKDHQYIYLAFKGKLDKEQIEKQLLAGNFASFQANLKKSYISLPRFLQLLEEDNIGTHTTRYKLARRLETNKVIKSVDNKIFSTHYGSLYYSYLSNKLDSQFNIGNWHSFLQDTMNNWRNEKKSIDRDYDKGIMEEEFNSFMEVFFTDLKVHLKDLKGQYPTMAEDLIYAYQKSQKNSYYHPKKESKIEKSQDSFTLIGNDTVLDKKDISKLFDPNTGLPRPKGKQITILIRHIPEKPASVENPLRQVCCIDRSYEINIIHNDKLEDILSMKNEDYTIFRTEIKDDNHALKYLLNSQLTISQYEEMDLDYSNFEDKNNSDAHESLQLNDAMPSDIAGREGLQLAEEYHKPWLCTLDKIKKKENGKINLASFNLSGYDFERIERYKFGEVHKFESLLSTMLDKYNIPFWKTAKLAEELYLNTGD